MCDALYVTREELGKRKVAELMQQNSELAKKLQLAEKSASTLKVYPDQLRCGCCYCPPTYACAKTELSVNIHLIMACITAGGA